MIYLFIIVQIGGYLQVVKAITNFSSGEII